MGSILRAGLAILPAVLIHSFFNTAEDFVTGLRVRWALNCSFPELNVPTDEAPLDLVNVVYATDGHDLLGLEISMLSLARTVSKPEHVAIYIIAAGQVVPHVLKAIDCFKKELEGEFPVLPAVHLLPEQACKLSNGSGTGSFHHEACSQRFVRYCLQQYLPTVSRVIWVDTDIVFRNDIRKLYTMRMDHPVAATLYFPWMSVRMLGTMAGEGLTRAALQSPHIEPLLDRLPFNAGIMVFDLTKWRSGTITDALFKWLGALGEKLCSNQLVLNLFFLTGFDSFDWRWNVMVPRRVGLQRKCLEEAYAVHWAGLLKPWYPWGWWMHGEVAAKHWPKKCLGT